MAYNQHIFLIFKHKTMKSDQFYNSIYFQSDPELSNELSSSAVGAVGADDWRVEGGGGGGIAYWQRASVCISARSVAGGEGEDRQQRC